MDDRNIYQRLLAIMTDLKALEKTLTIDMGKDKSYKAVCEADVLAAVKPLEAKHGVYSYPCDREIVFGDFVEKKTQYGPRVEVFIRVKTTYRFVNVDKPDECIETVTFGDGVDSQDKAPGKAITYSDKYALLKAYKIITGVDPDQYESGDIEPINTDLVKNKTDAPINPVVAEIISAEIDDLEKQGFKPKDGRSLYENIVDKCGVLRVEDIKESFYVSVVKDLEKIRKLMQTPDKSEKIKTADTNDLLGV